LIKNKKAFDKIGELGYHSNMHLNDIARIIKIAGDESRLRILCVIFKKPVCVSDIAANLKMSVASASHHLRVMAGSGLLRPVRNGKNVCYELTENTAVNDLKKFICKYNK